MVENTTQPFPDTSGLPATSTTTQIPDYEPGIAPSPLTTPELKHVKPEYDSPLYTEINIPLPPLPNSPPADRITAPTTSPSPPSSKSPPPTQSQTHSRARAHTLSSFSPFHRRRASSPTDGAVQQEKKTERRIELSMGAAARGRKHRSGTLDAAIVPAVMMLRAELFTPGQAETEQRNLELGKDKLEVIR